jgi:hypothetical protein
MQEGYSRISNILHTILYRAGDMRKPDMMRQTSLSTCKLLRSTGDTGSELIDKDRNNDRNLNAGSSSKSGADVWEAAARSTM